MCRPRLKRMGAYGADQTEKVVAFRAERMVKELCTFRADQTGKNGCIQKKWVLVLLIELKT